MPDIDLDAIRARAAAATPGPWFHRQSGLAGRERPYDWIGDAPDGKSHTKIIVGREAIYGGTPDYAFIAHARQDIPALLARVDELTAALQDIINPLGRLQRHADASGRRLSGSAHSIAHDVGFLQSIARDAVAPPDTGSRAGRG